MLHIVTWLWGEKYSGGDVRKLRSGFSRHLRQAHAFYCVTDRAETFGDGIITVPIWDIDLLKVKGCFARLRMFDTEWQSMFAKPGERIVCCDLDVVAAGPLDALFDRPEPFLIVHGANAANPCKFNGSLMMLRAGAHPEVWSEFTPEKAQVVSFHEFPDDQGWIWHMLPDAAGWQAGAESGVYAFQKPGWVSGDKLPADARMVVFPGWRSPEKFKHLPWIEEHWRA